MPFNKDFDDTYHLGIRAACDDVGVYCERVDEQVFDGRILDRIYNQIAHAHTIIADMSGKTPNVYYETGYAHALGKRVIPLARDIADIPFDLKDYPHIVYGNSIIKLKKDLATRLRWAINHPLESFNSVAPHMEFWISGRPVAEGQTVFALQFYDETCRSYRRTVTLDVRNASGATCNGRRFQLSLISKYITSDRALLLPDGRFMNIFPPFPDTFPDAWSSVELSFGIPSGCEHSKYTTIGVDAIFRELTEFGVSEVPLTVMLAEKEQREYATSLEFPTIPKD